MVDLKIGMNRGILLNSNLLCNSDKLKVVNWSNLSINKKNYHTKIEKKKKNPFLFFFLGVISFIVYLYYSNLLIFCLEKSLFILFFFFLTLFYLDEFKLSNNK
jgi:hypothetical protein